MKTLYITNYENGVKCRGYNMFDYLIVGSGLYGSICARELTDKGYRCRVVEKRNHVGGNCYTENVDGINIHNYGPHIFHTSNDKVWDYINKFVKFNNFIYTPKVSYKDKIYSFPINLMTLYQVFGVKTPDEAIKKLQEIKIPNNNPKNFEEYILSQVGTELYEIFIKGYTKKQWNIDTKNLPASIIKRLPIRTSFNENYYNDIYQGIPIGGYTQIFDKLLSGIDVCLNDDYFGDRSYSNCLAEKIIYTGPIDRFYDYKFGKLEYRSLRFEHEKINMEDYQGVVTVNYTDSDVPYTRIVEHKHFEFGKQPNTIITREYPEDYNGQNEPYYPINDIKNNAIFEKYKILSLQEKDVIFGGRLAEYKYYDMHQIIESALNFTNKIKKYKKV